jgi:hypothetical protein
MALQQQCQHRHEMALAAAEAAVQVGAFAGAGFEGALDETQGLIETDDQLWRDHISAQRIGSALNTFGQAQDEVTLVRYALETQHMNTTAPVNCALDSYPTPDFCCTGL